LKGCLDSSLLFGDKVIPQVDLYDASTICKHEAQNLPHTQLGRQQQARVALSSLLWQVLGQVQDVSTPIVHLAAGARLSDRLPAASTDLPPRERTPAKGSLGQSAQKPWEGKRRCHTHSQGCGPTCP